MKNITPINLTKYMKWNRSLDKTQTIQKVGINNISTNETNF